MFDLAAGDPLIELDGRMIGEGQKTLARLSVAAARLRPAQVASAVLHRRRLGRRAQGRSTVGDVFEATERAAARYRAGSRVLHLQRLPSRIHRTARRHLRADQGGALGARRCGSAMPAIAAQFDNLPDQMLELYTQDFLAAWRDALGKLRLRKLLADKPQYITLSAIGAPTSPLKQLLVSIADETMLTRERPARSSRRQRHDRNACQTPRPLTESVSSCAAGRRAPPSKSSSSRFMTRVEGTPSRADRRHRRQSQRHRRQPDLRNHSVAGRAGQCRAAGASRQAAQQRGAAAAAVLGFPARRGRANSRATSLASTAGQLQVALRNEVFPVCQQTIAGRYPFTRGSDRDVPLGDFARLFAPNAGSWTILQAVPGASRRHSKAPMGVASGRGREFAAVA